MRRRAHVLAAAAIMGCGEQESRLDTGVAEETVEQRELGLMRIARRGRRHGPRGRRRLVDRPDHQLTQIGVDDVICAGCDAIAGLERALEAALHRTEPDA